MSERDQLLDDLRAHVEDYRQRAEAAERELAEVREAHELLKRGIASIESNNVALRAQLEASQEALYKIADFAPGNGDVCEIIAKVARRAIVMDRPDATRADKR